MPRLALLAALGACLACTAPSPDEVGPHTDLTPNIIVILADDLGYADVGFQGLGDFTTPALDQLAASGVRFTNGYVSHPFCSPSRAGLLTGRYQHRFGHVFNPRFRAGEGLPLDQTLLPELLAEAGYISGIVGKWHLGDAAEYHPGQRGFDEFFGLLGGGHDYFESAGEDAREYLIPLESQGEKIPVKGYLTEQLSAAAMDFVRRHAGQPFFLYLSYNAPHGPLQAPPEFLERVASIEDPRRRTYAAMVTAMDDGIGGVLTLLEELELEENTLVFFLSDNGGPPPANASDNSPLRGTKGTVYEGGIRVPFVVAWKGRLAPGAAYEMPVSSLDIVPTAVAAAGLEVPTGLDGVDLMPFLSGEMDSAPHEVLFWRSYAAAQYAVRVGDRKVVRVLDRSPEVYALGTDDAESHDLAGDEPDAAETLFGRVREWAAEHPQPAWPGTSQPVHRNTAFGLGADQAEIDAWLAGPNR